MKSSKFNIIASLILCNSYTTGYNLYNNMIGTGYKGCVKKRFIHSSNLLLVNAENNTYKINNPEDNGIVLTLEEIKSLSDLTKIIEESGFPNRIEQSANVDTNYQTNKSSFSEAFPGFLKEISDEKQVVSALRTESIFTKIDLTDKNYISEVFEDKSIIEGLKVMIDNNCKGKGIELSNKVLSAMSLDEIVKGNDSDEIKELRQKIDNLTQNLEKYDSLKDLADFNQRVQNYLEGMEDLARWVKEHPAEIQAGISSFNLIGAVLAWRVALKAYGKVTFFNKLPEKLEIHEMQILERQRIKTIRRFNWVAVPLIAVYYGYINRPLIESLILKVEINNPTSPINPTSSMLMFTRFSPTKLKAGTQSGNTKFNWIIRLIIALSCLALIRYLPLFIYWLSPSFYDYLANWFYCAHGANAELSSSAQLSWQRASAIGVMDIYFINYICFIWLLMWWLLTLAELCIFIYFSINSNKISIPQYGPKFILNRLKDLKELGENNLLKGILLSQLTRVCLIHLFLVIIWGYFFIF